MKKKARRDAHVRERIPKTLKIRGRTWTVKVSNTLQQRSGILGCCTSYNKTIQIDGQLSPEETLVTAAHELLHSIFPYNIVGGRTEERIIEAMEEDFADLLRDNADKLAALFKKK